MILYLAVSILPVIYPFPRENVRHIHQSIVIRQRKRYHFVHNFHTKFIWIYAKFVQYKFLQIRNCKYRRALQILWLSQLHLKIILTLIT